MQNSKVMAAALCACALAGFGCWWLFSTFQQDRGGSTPLASSELDPIVLKLDQARLTLKEAEVAVPVSAGTLVIAYAYRVPSEFADLKLGLSNADAEFLTSETNVTEGMLIARVVKGKVIESRFLHGYFDPFPSVFALTHPQKFQLQPKNEGSGVFLIGVD